MTNRLAFFTLTVFAEGIADAAAFVPNTPARPHARTARIPRDRVWRLGNRTGILRYKRSSGSYRIYNFVDNLVNLVK